MYLRRVHVTIIGVLLVSAVVVGLTFDLHRIWRVGYTRLFLDVERTNLLAQDFQRAVHQVKQLFTADMVKGLPIVRLYIPQKAQSNLMSNLPGSVKSWQRGFKIYPDGKLRRVKVRYRGDNPVNWIHEKKSIRIKLRKKRLIDDIRVFDYLNIQEPDFLQEYLAYAVHKGLGLVTQHARLVEVFVNDRPSGVHIEVERLDENFSAATPSCPSISTRANSTIRNARSCATRTCSMIRPCGGNWRCSISIQWPITAT